MPSSPIFQDIVPYYYSHVYTHNFPLVLENANETYFYREKISLKMLAPEKYLQALSLTQVVSIDLIVKNSQGKVLVGKRKNKPAQGYFFVPGGRIYKNETIPQGIERLAEMELGISLKNFTHNFLCISDHIYPDNFLGAVDSEQKPVGTHYLCIGVELDLNKSRMDEKIFSDQHSAMNWLTQEEILSRKDVHPNTKLYFGKQGWYRNARKY